MASKWAYNLVSFLMTPVMWVGVLVYFIKASFYTGVTAAHVWITGESMDELADRGDDDS